MIAPLIGREARGDRMLAGDARWTMNEWQLDARHPLFYTSILCAIQLWCTGTNEPHMRKLPYEVVDEVGDSISVLEGK